MLGKVFIFNCDGDSFVVIEINKVYFTLLLEEKCHYEYIKKAETMWVKAAASWNQKQNVSQQNQTKSKLKCQHIIY